MPFFVSLRQENYNKYLLYLIHLYSVMFWIGVCAGIFILFFGQSIILLLLGEAYKDSFLALLYNIWNGIFISQAIARGIWMISEDLQKYRLYNNIIIVILNIILNISLIPIIGITGAALATFFTQFLGTWVIPFVWEPLRNSNLALIKSVNPKYLVSLGGIILERFSTCRR
jgi:O-antigen/teichoic acid export membrane protein